MGKKYNASDVSNLIRNLTKEKQNFEALVEAYLPTFKSLIGDVSSGELSGATWSKMGQVSEEIFVTSSNQFKDACGDLDQAIQKVRNAQSAVDYPEIDEDELNERLAHVQSRITFYQIESANSFNDILGADDAGQRLAQFEEQRAEIQKRLDQLSQFESATSGVLDTARGTFTHAMSLIRQIQGGGFTSSGQFVSGSGANRMTLYFEKPSNGSSSTTAEDVKLGEVSEMNMATKKHLSHVAMIAGMTVEEVIAMYMQAQKNSAFKTKEGLNTIRDFMAGEIAKLHPNVDFEKTDFSTKTDWNNWSRERLEDVGVYFNSDGTYVLDSAKAINAILHAQLQGSIDHIQDVIDRGGYGKGTVTPPKKDTPLPTGPDFNPGVD